MEKYFALVKNNLVVSIIVATDDFIATIQDQYDVIVDVTANRPNVGDSYYVETGTFTSNTSTAILIPVVQSACPMTGTEIGFEPFNLSEYSVSYVDGMVKIGCKSYSGPGLLDALYQVLVEGEVHPYCFTSLEDGPMHGKFGITWDDARLLYDTLIKVKF